MVVLHNLTAHMERDLQQLIGAGSGSFHRLEAHEGIGAHGMT